MKVQTDLKAGNFFDQAAQTASQAYGTTKGWVSSADQQANTVVAKVTSPLSSAWNYLVNLF